MQYSLFFILILSLVSCASSSLSSKSTTTTTTTTTKLSSVHKKSQLPKRNKDRENDEAVKSAIEQSLIQITLFLKKARILTLQKHTPVCIFFQENYEGKSRMALYWLKSQPGSKPLQLGEKIEVFSFPEIISLKIFPRYIWCKLDGNLDFFEKDKTLRVFEHPPQGDIVIFPKNRNNPRRGLLDIIKSRAQVQFYQYIEERISNIKGAHKS